MINYESSDRESIAHFTEFDEMVLTGDLAEIELLDEIRQQRIRLKGHFALAAELGTEETEEPEEE